MLSRRNIAQIRAVVGVVLGMLGGGGGSIHHALLGIAMSLGCRRFGLCPWRRLMAAPT
jgi:hypothetical protein